MESFEDCGPLMEAEARLPPTALLMCSTRRVLPCTQQPCSSLTAASADCGPLTITMATLETAVGKRGICFRESIWEANRRSDIRTCNTKASTVVTDE